MRLLSARGLGGAPGAPCDMSRAGAAAHARAITGRNKVWMDIGTPDDGKMDKGAGHRLTGGGADDYYILASFTTSIQ